MFIPSAYDDEEAGLNMEEDKDVNQSEILENLEAETLRLMVVDLWAGMAKLEKEITFKDKAFEDYSDCCEGQIESLKKEQAKLENILIQTQTDNERMAELNSLMEDRWAEMTSVLMKIAYPAYRTEFAEQRAAGVSWERIYEDLALNYLTGAESC